MKRRLTAPFTTSRVSTENADVLAGGSGPMIHVAREALAEPSVSVASPAGGGNAQGAVSCCEYVM